MTEDRHVNRWATWLAVAVLVVIAAILRGWNLGGECFYSDECASVQHLGAASLSGFLSQVRLSDPPMTPLFFVLEYGWSCMTGQNTAALRLLPLFFGLMAIPLLYVLGTLLYGIRGGLAAAAFSTFSLGQIYYSQEMRPYALVLVLALISLIALWQGTRKDGARGWWMLNWLCNTLLVWCHLFTVFFIFSQGCYLLIRLARDRKWPLPIWWGLAQTPNAGMLYLWVRSINYTQLSTAAEWRLEIVHSYLQPLSDFLLFAGAGVPLFRDVPLAGGWRMAGVMWRFFGLVFLLYLGLNAWRFLWRPVASVDQKRRQAGKSFAFVVTMLFVPPVTLFLLSSLVYSCHSSRYVLYGSIPFALMIGGVVALLPGKWFRFVFIAGVFAVQCTNLWVHPKPWRPDTRSVAQYLESHGAGEMPITAYHGADIPSLLLVCPKSVPMSGIESIIHLEDIVPSLQKVDQAAQKERWLLIWTHQYQPDRLITVEQELHANGWMTERNQFGFVNPVYAYRLWRP